MSEPKISHSAAEYPADALRAAYDHGYRDAETAKRGEPRIVLDEATEEKKAMVARIEELEKELAAWDESQESVERAQQRRDIDVMNSVRVPLEARIAELESLLGGARHAQKENFARAEKAEARLADERQKAERDYETLRDRFDLNVEERNEALTRALAAEREAAGAKKEAEEVKQKLERTWSNREIARLKGELEITWQQVEAGDRVRETAEAERDRLRKALEVVEKDKQRLDFLSCHMTQINLDYRRPKGEAYLYSGKKTLRELVDIEMARREALLAPEGEETTNE